MIILDSPLFLFLLIIIPLIIIIKKFSNFSNSGPVRISSSTIVSDTMIRKGKIKNKILSLIQYFAIILIIVSLSRPQVVQDLQEKNIDIVDIVLVIDISSSMLATDFKPNRLEVVKKTAKNFIQQRDSDRLGILVFAGESFIQCPLTIDKDVLLSLMDEVSVAQQSYDGTAIGMAIANATNRLRSSESKSKVMILSLKFG